MNRFDCYYINRPINIPIVKPTRKPEADRMTKKNRRFYLDRNFFKTYLVIDVGLELAGLVLVVVVVLL